MQYNTYLYVLDPPFYMKINTQDLDGSECRGINDWLTWQYFLPFNLEKSVVIINNVAG